MADLSKVVVSGPLEPFAADFAVELSRQGFKPLSVVHQMRLAADLSGWLAAERLGPAGLSLEVTVRFCEARRAAGCTSRVTVRALGPLLGYLRGLGVSPAAGVPVPDGPVEELLLRFRRYLEQERGFVPAAARGYVDKVARSWSASPARTSLSLGAWEWSRCAGSWWSSVHGWGAARRS